MNRHEKMSRKKFTENYNMPWEVVEIELKAFDDLVEPLELNESNYSKYRRGFLLRADIAYKSSEAKNVG